jgi:hypothetical protein
LDPPVPPRGAFAAAPSGAGHGTTTAQSPGQEERKMTRLLRTVTLISGLAMGTTAFAGDKPAEPAPGSTPAATTKAAKSKKSGDKKDKHKSGDEHKQHTEQK